jgi:hypothetical protein
MAAIFFARNYQATAKNDPSPKVNLVFAWAFV